MSPASFRSAAVAAGLPAARKLLPSRPANVRHAGAKTTVRPERAALGIAAMLATTLLFPISDVASKYLTQSLPPIEIAWLRYLVFVLMVLPMFGAGAGKVVETTRPSLQIARGVVGGLATAVAMLSFSYLPVAEATAIGFVSPVFVTALAVVLLSEKVGVRRWAAALVGLLGVMIIVRPGGETFQPASLIPLGGAAISAFSTVATRMMKAERSRTTMFYSAVSGTIVLTIPTLFSWVTPGWSIVPFVLVSGVFAALANLTQIFAYRHASASLLVPFSYTQLVWASAFGYMFFGNVPTLAMFIGAAVIAASGIYTANRERIRRRQEAEAHG
jgi:drug/metabolite transporter (DMT)-like permease